MQLHQPNWRKYLSLKPDRNILRDDSYFANAAPPAVSAQVEEAPAPSSPAKKRKRTDEEIAQRKEKKLRSKANGVKEWQSLSNGNPAPSVPESTDGASNENETEETEDDGKAISQPASDALLSSKAKEIAKARREEKRKEKPTPTPNKTPEKPTVGSGDDKKANEVDEYLKEYDAHVNAGGEWKFKKQHQNWILKNLYIHPWKSDEFLYQYLKSIQGQARERFVAGAAEVTKSDEGKFSDGALRRAQAILELK
jgi:WKF domain